MATAPALEVQGVPRAQNRPRVLLVDDDERNLLALSEVLDPVATVVTASSGRMALRELLKDEFAVILLDVFMPDMDGYETASLIRQRAQTARIPIIFLSAVNKETEHLMRGYAMGAVDYVFKPVDPVILKSKVAVFVDLFELRQQVARQVEAEQELREAQLRAESERLSYERELQQAQLRQAAIVEALPIILYLEELDAHPRVPKFVSGNFEAMTGFTFEDVNRAPNLWAERVHPEDRERVLAGIAERQRGRSMSLEYRWQCANGGYKYFLDQAVLLHGPDGEPAEYAGTLLDVSEQRQLEQQLVQSRKAEALGQLTGGIAHDFNNILAAILGGLRLIQARVQLGSREAQILEQMRHAGEKGAELVRHLMAFARKQDLAPSCIAVGKLRESVAGLLEHAIGHGVTVQWDLAEEELQFFADEAQLELALVNLVINARDAMPEGGTIAVSIERHELPREERSGDWLRVRVRDEGTGIPPELIQRVTEPFFTTKETGKGTGLGLSMVAGFVEQSGGVFEISSDLGRGTQIDMVLPARRSESLTEAVTPVIDEEHKLIGSILLVDDDPGVRLVLAEQLRDLGLDVVVAADAEQALGILEANCSAPEFVLTDLSMPGMDGLRLLAEINGRWPNIRGAMMTGNPQERISRCDPAMPVIRKPIAFDELRRLLTVA